MSDNEGNSRKMPKSVQERVQEYRKNNPELNKLSREKQNLPFLREKLKIPIFYFLILLPWDLLPWDTLLIPFQLQQHISDFRTHFMTAQVS